MASFGKKLDVGVFLLPLKNYDRLFLLPFKNYDRTIIWRLIGIVVVFGSLSTRGEGD